MAGTNNLKFIQNVTCTKFYMAEKDIVNVNDHSVKTHYTDRSDMLHTSEIALGCFMVLTGCIVIQTLYFREMIESYKSSEQVDQECDQRDDLTDTVAELRLLNATMNKMIDLAAADPNTCSAHKDTVDAEKDWDIVDKKQ